MFKDDPETFQIDRLDHVAIRVRDMDVSVAWYERVLGLKKYQVPEWGDFPIFMFSGKCGVALFPANLNDTELDSESKNIKIDHFAFHVSNKNFDKAISRYEALNLEFKIEDHIYFHSVYTQDPDGHKVELTTIVVDPDSFYSK